MLAATNPVPYMARTMESRPMQKQPFDARLLCAKLEAHQRQVNGSQDLRNEKSARRKSAFVPQTAAKQFVSTATPMPLENKRKSMVIRPSTALPLVDERQSRFQRPTTSHAVKPAPTNDAPTFVNPKQFYAALGAGMSESEAVAAISQQRRNMESSRERSPPLVDSQKKTSKPSKESRAHNANLDPQDAQTRRNGTEDARQKRQSYRPGDAERRRADVRTDVKISFNDIAFGLKLDVPSAPFHSNHPMLGYRQARDEVADMPYDLYMDKEVKEYDPLSSSRPRLVNHDRPNWAQDSQCGDDMPTLLHLPRMNHRSKDGRMRDDERRRSHSETRGLPMASSQPRRGSENLIADAVKKIKKDGKIKRRESVMNFFKRTKS